MLVTQRTSSGVMARPKDFGFAVAEPLPDDLDIVRDVFPIGTVVQENIECAFAELS